MNTGKGQVASTQDLASGARGQSSRLVDEVLGPRLTSQVDQSFPTECARAWRIVANSIAVGVLCSLFPVRATAGNQTEAVGKIEEMSVAAGWLARG